MSLHERRLFVSGDLVVMVFLRSVFGVDPRGAWPVTLTHMARNQVVLVVSIVDDRGDTCLCQGIASGCPNPVYVYLYHMDKVL